MCVLHKPQRQRPVRLMTGILTRWSDRQMIHCFSLAFLFNWKSFFLTAWLVLNEKLFNGNQFACPWQKEQTVSHCLRNKDMVTFSNFRKAPAATAGATAVSKQYIACKQSIQLQSKHLFLKFPLPSAFKSIHFQVRGSRGVMHEEKESQYVLMAIWCLMIFTLSIFSWLD